MAKTNVAGIAAFTTKSPVRVATAASLPAYTRTGNVLQANANGAMATVDGVTLTVGDRFLLKNGASGVDNGIYAVLSVGSGSTPWTATRASDADDSTKVTSGMVVAAVEGSSYADCWFALTTDAPITLNTTALTFVQFTGSGLYVPLARTVTAGNGITGGGDLSANRTFAVQAADSSVSVGGGGVSVGTITTQVLAALAASGAAKDMGGGAISNVGNVDGVDVSGIVSATTANVLSALAAASGAVALNNQNITSVGTVDGRDVSTDGTTLDGHTTTISALQMLSDVAVATTASVGAAGTLSVGGFTVPTKKIGRDADTLVRLTVDEGNSGANATAAVSTSEGGGYTNVTITLARTGYSSGAGSRTIGGYVFENSWTGGTVDVQITRDDDDSSFGAMGGGNAAYVGSGSSGGNLTQISLIIRQAATASQIQTVINSTGTSNLTCASGSCNFNDGVTVGNAGGDDVPAASGSPTSSSISSTRASIQTLIDGDAPTAAVIGTLTGGAGGTTWSGGCSQTQLIGGYDYSDGSTGKAPNTLDGYSLQAGDRILVKSQDFPKRNGVFTVSTVGSGANGVWARATDADNVAELRRGTTVRVLNGSTNAYGRWRVAATPATLDTSDITWTQDA